MSNESIKEDDGGGGRDVLSKLESEYSYIDFAIHEKFYRRFWIILGFVLGIPALLLTVAAFLGGQTLLEMKDQVAKAENAYERFEEANSYFLEQDSLQAIKNENGHYFYYLTPYDVNLIAHALNKSFEDQGFGVRNANIDTAMNRYFYVDGKLSQNDAIAFVAESIAKREGQTAIGVIHNGMPQVMLDRVDTIIRRVYDNPSLNHFQDTSLPLGGFIYSIGY